jgi:MoaA/NifB/PqqE/SkfB family radical SAM enzyme
VVILILIKRKFNKLQGELRCLKRLKGLPISGKMRYAFSTVLGETTRTRVFKNYGLRLVEISLTDRCQCRCKHCFAATQQPLPEKEELSTSEVKILIDDLSELKVTEVCFSGGEPLLRNDVLELVSYAHRKGLVSRLITNGILLDEKMVIALKSAGINWCSISIDNPKREQHDAFRRYPGCYEKAIEGLSNLVANNIPCSIITVARKALIYSGELDELVKIGKRIGVAVVRINFPVPIGRFLNQDNETLNLEERERVRGLLKYGNVVMENPSEGTKCTAAVTKVNVLPNGDVTPCVFVPLSYGNIRRSRFQQIWSAMQEYNKQFKATGYCPMCDPILRDQVFEAAEKQKISAEAMLN